MQIVIVKRELPQRFQDCIKHLYSNLEDIDGTELTKLLAREKQSVSLSRKGG